MSETIPNKTCFRGLALTGLVGIIAFLVGVTISKFNPLLVSLGDSGVDFEIFSSSKNKAFLAFGVVDPDKLFRRACKVAKDLGVPKAFFTSEGLTFTGVFTEDFGESIKVSVSLLLISAFGDSNSLHLFFLGLTPTESSSNNFCETPLEEK